MFLTTVDGYGPFNLSQAILSDLSIINQDTSGITYPKDYGKISLRNFHIQHDQYKYQEYKANKIPKDNFFNYMERNKIDTTRLSENYIDEGVIIGIGDAFDSMMVVFVDTDNDEDLSNESPIFYKKFNSVEEEVEAMDSLKSINVKIEYYDGRRINDEIINILLNPYKGRLGLSGPLAEAQFLATSIPGYLSGIIEVKGLKYQIALTNRNWSLTYNQENTKILLSPDPDAPIPKINHSSTIYKIGDTVNVDGIDIKFKSISINGDKLIINEIGENSNPQGLDISSNSPNIQWKDINNNNFDLSSLRGNYVLLDFWGTWCNPCIAEIPNLMKAYDKYNGSNFEIVSIAVDRDIQTVKEYIIENDMPWLHLFQTFKDTSKVAPVRLYKVGSFPTTILINPYGKILAKNLRGEKLIDELEKYLK